MSRSLTNDRALTAKLLVESGMMDVVKEFASRFGTGGKLPSVAVITETDAAYYGEKPKPTEKVKPGTGW